MKTRLLPVTRDLRDGEQVGRWSAIEQERTDQALEAEWRRRVRANPKEVAALPGRIHALS